MFQAGMDKTCGQRNDCHVKGSEFLCPVLQQVKIPNIRVRSTERYTDQVGDN